MNPILADLLHGAGLSHIANMDGGFTQSSGFIRRLMAENKLKHNGQYKYPVWKLAPGSTMNKAVKFEYKKIANKGQSGANESAYGASPFIQRHFGQVRAVASEEEPKESVKQQEARKAFSVAEHKPEKMEDEQKYAEEHSAKRTEGEYNKLFPQKSDSKVKESERKKEAYKRGKEEAKNRQYDYDLPEIPSELKPYIKEEDLEAILPGLVKRAKIGLLYKKAREVLPKQLKTTPPIIKMLDKMNSKIIEEHQQKNTEENKTYERIRARQDEFEKELQSRPEIKRLVGTPQWRQAWSSQVGDLNRAKNHFLNEIADEMIQSQLPDPGITKENVNTYKIPKNYF